MLGGELHGIEKSITFFLVSFYNFDDRADIDRGSPAESTILVSVVVEDESPYHDPCEEILCFWRYPFEVVLPLQHMTADLKYPEYYLAYYL